MFFSPLEQFDLLVIFNVWGFNIVNIVFFFALILLFFIFFQAFFLGSLFVGGMVQRLLEVFYHFLVDMVKQQTGVEGIQYIPYFFTVFFFILMSNLVGMLPFSFTITAHLSVTFFLAFAFNFGFTLIGFNRHGYKFLYLFKPEGAPLLLLPLIVVIEIVSYLIRTFSLSIRLFANMMAGHCLLFVISSFVFSLLNVSFFLLVPIVFVYLAIFVLEFAIAFLQAYVFTILLCIYLNDGLHPGH